MSSLYSIGAMNQLGDALEKAGYTPDDITKLKQSEDLGNIKAVLYGQAQIVPVAAVPVILLRLLGTVEVPATAAQFVARDHFKVDTSDTAAVKVSYLGDNLKAWFADKVEGTRSGVSSLRYHTLTKDTLDAPIIAGLGGEAKAETTIGEVWSLMERQPNGKRGKLLTNGYANIFYVRDANGVLCAVNVYWYDDGWRVLADSVERPYRWLAGLRVFSRNA